MPAGQAGAGRQCALAINHIATSHGSVSAPVGHAAKQAKCRQTFSAAPG